MEENKHISNIDNMKREHVTFYNILYFEPNASRLAFNMGFSCCLQVICE